MSETGFLAVKNLAVDILLGPTLLGASVKSTSLRKQMLFSNGSSSVVIKGTGPEDSLVVQVSKIAEHPICCKVARTVRIPVTLRIPELVQGPATALQIVETQTHLLQRRPAKVARSLRGVTANCPLTQMLANWSKRAFVLSKNMVFAQYTAPSEIIQPMPVYGKSVDTILLYKEAETKDRK